MCGIAGAIVDHTAPEAVLSSLKKLEYRGYDSAGLSLLSQTGIATYKEAGKIAALSASLPLEVPRAGVAIGHTRWATHGKPSKLNSHPHEAGSLSLVHNGIISNADALRKELHLRGVDCISDTDSEIVVRLLSIEMEAGHSPLAAMDMVLPKLEGSYALAFIDAHSPGTIYFARMNSPLIIGRGDKWMVASDVAALDSGIDKVCYPEDGVRGAIHATKGLFAKGHSQADVKLLWEDITVVPSEAEKGAYKTFMMKEIMEQPDYVRRQAAEHFKNIKTLYDNDIDFNGIDRIDLTACGTAHYACQIGAHWLRQFAQIDARTVIASEADFTQPCQDNHLGVLVSQSGETADTLSAARQMSASGMKMLSLVNTEKSSLERMSDLVLNIQAGPEIGVASTKAFTAQLLCLLRLSLKAGLDRDCLTQAQVEDIMEGVRSLPAQMSDYLETNRMSKHADIFLQARSAIFLGKAQMVPLANEGALKVKECSYVHAQGYPAGELKHGPIALIEDAFPVVCISPTNASLPKMVSAMEEVVARGARVLMLTDDEKAYAAGQDVEILPPCHEAVQPILYSLPLQLLAHHVATQRDLDVDRPRNLAKSVTVT